MTEMSALSVSRFDQGPSMLHPMQPIKAPMEQKDTTSETIPAPAIFGPF
ncbi:MAG: hypothetical protein RH946_21585 [Rhodospirillales bacterium]